jgi:hypothetical protein
VSSEEVDTALTRLAPRTLQSQIAKSFHLLLDLAHGALVLLVHFDASMAETVYSFLQTVEVASPLSMLQIVNFCQRLLSLQLLTLEFLGDLSVGIAPFFYFRLECDL